MNDTIENAFWTAVDQYNENKTEVIPPEYRFYYDSLGLITRAVAYNIGDDELDEKYIIVTYEQFRWPTQHYRIKNKEIIKKEQITAHTYLIKVVADTVNILEPIYKTTLDNPLECITILDKPYEFDFNHFAYYQNKAHVGI